MKDMDLNIIDDVLSGKLSFILGYGKQEGKCDSGTIKPSLMTIGVYKAVGLVNTKKSANVTLEDKIIFEGPSGKISIFVYDVIDMFNYYAVKENSAKLFPKVERAFFEQQSIETVEDTIQTFLKLDGGSLIGGIPYPDFLITYDLGDVMVETESMGENYSIIPVASSIKDLKCLQSKPLGIIKCIISSETKENDGLAFLYQDSEDYSLDEDNHQNLKMKRNCKRYLDDKNRLEDKQIIEFDKLKNSDLELKLAREKKRMEKNPEGSFTKKKKYKHHRIVIDKNGEINIIRK